MMPLKDDYYIEIFKIIYIYLLRFSLRSFIYSSPFFIVITLLLPNVMHDIHYLHMHAIMFF